MIQIVYRDVPIGALENSTIQFNNKQNFVDENDLKNEVVEADKYGTLEEDYYLLDGTFKTFPDAPTQMEYVSEEMSNEEGIFNTPIIMTRTFTNRYSATGLSIKFDTNTGDYCTEFKVQWFRDDEEITSVICYPTGCEFMINHLAEAFDKMVITFYKTSKPYRYLKIHYLLDGLVRIFDDTELMNVELTEQISETAEQLPTNTFSFDLVSQKELAYLFQNKQPMKAYHNDDFMGSFFIDTAIQNSRSEFTLNMMDYIGILDTEKTMGGLYTEILVADLLTEILGTIPFELDESFTETILSGYLPISSKRKALQQIAFSIGAIIDTSRSETIKILPIQNVMSSTFGIDRVFRGIKTEMESLITEIKLTEHNYYTKNVEDTLFEEKLKGTIKIELTEPHRNYAISNGTIIESHPNYVIISGTGSTVTLTGKIYTDKTKALSISNPMTTASTISKVLEYNECTLVTATNSEEVLNRLASICFSNKKITCRLILAGEQVGDMVTLVTDYGTKNAIIISLITDLNGIGKYAEAELLEIE